VDVNVLLQPRVHFRHQRTAGDKRLRSRSMIAVCRTAIGRKGRSRWD
jgi:hypothetical protein